MAGKPQIHDGPAYYPNSSVLYTRFNSADVRKVFAYLRAREEIYQKDLARYAGEKDAIVVRFKIEEVEAMLIWLTSNCRVGKKKKKKLRFIHA